MTTSTLGPNKGFSVWIIGPVESSSTSVGTLLTRALTDLGFATVRLDSGETHNALWPELGSSPDDTKSALLRIGQLCIWMKSAGIISVVTAGAQFPDTRKKLRRSLGEYVEIYCSSDTLPVSSDEHEHQDDSDLSVSAEDSPPEDMVRTIIEWLSEMGYLERPAGNDYTEAEESEVLKRLEQLGYL